MSTEDISDPIENIRASMAYMKKRYGVVSEEALEYRRRRGPDKIIEPTEADWEIYRAACAALAAADENPFITVWDLADIGEPRAVREPGDYAETEDEWIARVATLVAESRGRVPDDLGQALSMREAMTLLAVLEAMRQQIRHVERTGWTREGEYETGGLIKTLPTTQENDQ